MSSPSPVLAEPLTLGQVNIPRRAWCSGKLLVGCSLLVGLVLALLRNGGQHLALKEPAITMIGTPSSMSCPWSGAPMSVNAMEDALKRHGIPSSPMTRFALTSYAATRDMSTAAQVKEEFARLDPATQAKLKRLERDVVARAEFLKGDQLAGATAPLGFWDPVGFAKKWEGKAGGPAVLRAAEVKHGRVCMLATLGIIVSEKFHPIFDAWGDGTFVSAAGSHFSKTAIEQFWPQFWLLCGFLEWKYYQKAEVILESSLPGDLGFDPLGLKPKKPEDLTAMQNKELNNGRLAMLASAGIVAQEMVTGQKIF